MSKVAQIVLASSSDAEETDTTTFYSEIDGEYGRFFRHAFYYRTLHRVTTPIVSNLIRRLPPGARVLDVGCGDGLFSVLLAKHGLDVVALDPAPGMRAATARRARGQNVPLRITDGDAQNLPFPDASFDAVVCLGSVLHHLADPLTGLSELARVIKPGGWLLLDSENPGDFGAPGEPTVSGDADVLRCDWPFHVDGRTEVIRLTFPSAAKLEDGFRAARLTEAKRRGVHILTWRWAFTRQSSRLLDRGEPSFALRVAAAVDRLIGMLPAFAAKGSTTIRLLRKAANPDSRP